MVKKAALSSTKNSILENETILAGGLICRGARIRIHPNAAQAAQFDMWRKNCRQLWNLLLGIEQAAYSGERFKPRLKWRQKWLDVLLETHNKLLAEHAAGKREKPPVPISEDKRAAILGRHRAICEPKLFLWDDELLKVLARLKQEPLCAWIGDIHSHAAQRVAKEVVLAIRTMLLERKKRAAGKDGRNAGFPRFKRVSAYAEGSVYFANTQLVFDAQSQIKFPLGIGKVNRGRMNHIPKGARLMGARIFREGKHWWLSAQFQFKQPMPLPKTGREGGLKISASIIATTVDNDGVVNQIRAPREPARHVFQMNLESKSLSRRSRFTKAFEKQSARLAYRHARNRNVRDDLLHKTSRSIANSFDAISVQKMDVAEMMKKCREKKSNKSLRKLNAGAAMSRLGDFVRYKMVDGGREHHETNHLYPEIQTCSSCQSMNYMPLSKQRMQCRCGNVLERRVNAALNQFDQLQAAKAAAE